MKGGIQGTIQIPNSENTCMLDAYINSIINSHSLCKYLYSDSQTIELDKMNLLYSKFHDNTEEYKSSYIFLKYLLSLYVKAYFTISNYPKRSSYLDFIRLYMEYIHNAEDFEVCLDSYLPTGKSIQFMSKYFDMRVLLYRDKMEDGDIDSASGESASIIGQIFEECPLVMYKSDGIFPTSIPSQISDIYVFYPYSSIMSDANKINKEMMNHFNTIYDHALTRNGEFVCTDLILDQFEINEPTSEHSAYYNMLENNIQNESIISHLPFDELYFDTEKCSDIYTLIDEGLKRSIPAIHRKTINYGFYYPRQSLGFYIPTVLHFQRIPNITNPKEYTLETLLYRLRSLKDLMLSQNDVPDFNAKYMRHVSKIQDVIKFYESPTQTLLSSMYANPFSQFEKYARPRSGMITNITKRLREYRKARNKTSRAKLELSITDPLSYVNYSRFNEMVI